MLMETKFRGGSPSPPSACTPERGICTTIEPLGAFDAARVRAAHYLPTFAVAVEAAYQFLRLLGVGSVARHIRVVADPRDLNFLLDLLFELPPCCSRVENVKQISLEGDDAIDAASLAHLTVVSQEVKLRVNVEVLAERSRAGVPSPPHHACVLYEGRWTSCSPLKGKDVLSEVLIPIGERAEQWCRCSCADRIAKCSSLIKLQCEVIGLFCNMPVRRRIALQSRGGFNNRMRSERQAVVMVAYRVAAERILAPFYLLPQGGGRRATSVYLRLSDVIAEGGRAAYDTASVVFIGASRSGDGAGVDSLVKRKREYAHAGGESETLSTVYRLLQAFLPHLSQLAVALGLGNNAETLCLREVVVARAKFAMVYHAPHCETHVGTGLCRHAYNCLGSVLILSADPVSGECYVVDERHRVYRHLATLPKSLHPLFVFVDGKLLEGRDAQLKRMFQAVVQQHVPGVGRIPHRANGNNPKRGSDEDDLPTVRKVLTKTEGKESHNAVATGVRVSFLARQLASTVSVPATSRAIGGINAAAASVPRRTPFCPYTLMKPVPSADTLPRARTAMPVAPKPSCIVPRIFRCPVVWRGGEAPDENEPIICPFRGNHFLAQWDRKFLLLDTGDAAGLNDTASTECNEQRLPSARATATESRHSPIPPKLFITDQHAIHERLRLEYFLAHAESYVEPQPSLTTFPVKIPHDMRHCVAAYEGALKRWGWRFSHNTPQPNLACFPEATIDFPDTPCPRKLFDTITQWPCLTLEGHRLVLDTVCALRQTLEEIAAVFPASHVSALRATNTPEGDNCERHRRHHEFRVIPSAVLQFFVTRSCRGAIMFGDRIKDEHAKLLVDSLRAVGQYSVCSHGRPSFAVVRRREG
ncbi:uncharacterized protein TEOVI_000214500 [Trypanosoma equiperdum]|uniref:MutL C-terminal dimerisation domain-containing protein n=1 Tax=Trypanosoma equiperdum TaxID=5694 RepID=A0A1G4IDV6_TRYEQ|nr:hypothetical protein, conserved [Trypanosoma equiperdum]